MARSVALIVGLMAILGWPSLSMPFRGDEALFALVARDLASGAVLYRDHWDIANPGVFWFYQLAGTLFGFTEEGIRLLEWLWMTAFVLTVSAASRREGETRWPLAPVFLVGAAYYAAGYSATSTLTKTEGLVAFPMFLAIWLAAPAPNGARRRFPILVLAGATGGIVLLFKFLLGGCLAIAWLYLLGVDVRGQPRKARSALAFTAGVGGGLLLVLGAAYGYFAAHGMSGVVFHTLFELPPRFLAEGDRGGMERLALSIKWFLGQYTPILAAAVLAVACRWPARRHPVVVALLLAFAAAFVALLAQRLSWWSYHFLLPGSLAGVIASCCWPSVGDAVRSRLGRALTVRERGVLIAVAGVLALEMCGAGIYQSLRVAKNRLGMTAENRRAIRETTGSAYDDALGETSWLAGAEPGPIYVCGDPLFYWLSGRSPALSISGWSLEIYPAEIRAKLADDLRRIAPTYVHISSSPYRYDILLRDRYPEMSAVIATEYTPIRTSKQGTWYQRRPVDPKAD